MSAPIKLALGPLLLSLCFLSCAFQEVSHYPPETWSWYPDRLPLTEISPEAPAIGHEVFMDGNSLERLFSENQGSKDYTGEAYGFWKTVLGEDLSLNWAFEVNDSSCPRRLWLVEPGELSSARVLAHKGLPGANSKTSIPVSGDLRGILEEVVEGAFLILEISNFHDPAGISAPYMRLFTQEVFRQKQLSADFFRFFIAGVLAYIILHFLFFYFQRREEPSALWIALFSFLVLIRHVATQRLLPDFFPGWISADGFELQIFLELATMYLMLPVFYTYLRNLYSLETQDLVEKLFWGFGVLSSVAVALLPLNLHYFLLLPNQLVILVGSVLVIVSFVRTLLKRRIGAGIAMSGFIVFFLTILQDILFAQRIIQSVYLAPYGFLAFLVSHSLLLSRTFAKAMKSTEVLNESLYRFVPREFLGHLEKESVMDVNLGDSNELSMTVLFSDIRDFTSISEEMGAQATFSFLNEYYGRVGPMIRNQGGYIDKYIGDAILALFPGPPQNALQAGKDMLELVTQFNKENQNRLPKLRIGIGIHCGDLMIGTLGEKERLDGTVISDTVNTASRIENKTKEYPSRLLVSEMVLNGLPSEVRLSFEDFGEITLKGKTRRTRLFGLKED